MSASAMLWHRWTNFKQSLVKQSRVYMIIVITADVNGRILNNITWYPLLELKHIRIRKYLLLNVVVNGGVYKHRPNHIDYIFQFGSSWKCPISINMPGKRWKVTAVLI